MSKVNDTQIIILDFSGIQGMQTVTAKQGDDKSRFIQIKPVSNGEPLKLSNSKSVDFRCLKPDRTSYTAPAVKNNDGTITVELDKQVLAVPGNVKADIIIAGENGEILSSSVFIIRVEPSATNGNYIPSKSEEKRQADFDMDGHTVTNLAEPINERDAVTKRYTDKAIASSKPMLVTFNNTDFKEDNSAHESPISINFILESEWITLQAKFDINRLNFTISEGAGLIFDKVSIEGELFDASIIDMCIKEKEGFELYYGEEWINEGGVYTYFREYVFSDMANARQAFNEIQEDVSFTGFQVIVNEYNQITAKEV